MRSFIQSAASRSTPSLLPANQVPESSLIPICTACTLHPVPNLTSAQPPPSDDIFRSYLSDISDDDADLKDEDVGTEHQEVVHKNTHQSDQTMDNPPVNEEFPFHIRAPPPLKRQCHDIPVRVKRQKIKEEHHAKLVQALKDIEKLISSKREIFVAGHNGLQAYRARAIQSYLHMVVINKRKCTAASEIAAESQGFSAKWGSRMVCKWVRSWVNKRELPLSTRGHHTKSFSLLSDPAIRAELRSYVRSNKWAMDPAKLVEFSEQKMIPAAAKQYVEKIVDDEMPRGLKRYMEVELFPRIQLKVGKGVSLQTACRFLRREGFRYTEHKKSLYYDGHEWPDVVNYHQKVFLPAMKEFRRRLVEYMSGDDSVRSY
jgi:hypothetical protein